MRDKNTLLTASRTNLPIFRNDSTYKVLLGKTRCKAISPRIMLETNINVSWLDIDLCNHKIQSQEKTMQKSIMMETEITAIWLNVYTLKFKCPNMIHLNLAHLS